MWKWAETAVKRQLLLCSCMRCSPEERGVSCLSAEHPEELIFVFGEQHAALASTAVALGGAAAV